MHYKLDIKPPPLWVLIILISFPSASTVLISAALPAISDYFHVSNGVTQQLMTLFVVGYALGQLIYAPFANAFGRKFALYIGVFLYCLSCAICLSGVYAHNIILLFIGRFFMALGSSVGMVITFTVINDFYFPEQSRKIIGYTVLSYAFVPALAVTLGGLITSHLSWIDCLYFYVLYGVIILFAAIQLPETLQAKDKKPIVLKHIAQQYLSAFSNIRLVMFASVYGLMGAYIYVIASAAPFTAMDTIGLSPASYGLLLLIPYCTQFLGSYCSGRFSHKISVFQMMGVGFSSVVVGTLIMFICFSFGVITTLTLLLPISFMMFGLPMTYGSASVIALAGFQDKATGAAIMSFITMTIAFIATLTLSLLPNHNPIVMPSLFLGTSLIASLVIGVGIKRYKNKSLS